MTTTVEMEFKPGDVVRHIGRRIYQAGNTGRVVEVRKDWVVVEFLPGKPELVRPAMLTPSIMEVGR